MMCSAARNVMFAMQAMCPSGVMYAFGTWAEHIASLRVKRATSFRSAAEKHHQPPEAAASLTFNHFGLIRETNNGILAGITKEKAKAEFPGLYWSALEWDQAYPNGESPARFFNRIKLAWDSFRRQTDTLPGNTLLVTHGGVIDAILCIENGKANKHVTFQTAHATIVCVP